MESITSIKDPIYKNSRCNEGKKRTIKQIVTMKCLKKLNPNILCKVKRFVFFFFFK